MDLLWKLTFLCCLLWQNCNGTLYAVVTTVIPNDNELYSIDPTTGAIEPVSWLYQFGFGAVLIVSDQNKQILYVACADVFPTYTACLATLTFNNEGFMGVSTVTLPSMQYIPQQLIQAANSSLIGLNNSIAFIIDPTTGNVNTMTKFKSNYDWFGGVSSDYMLYLFGYEEPALNINIVALNPATGTYTEMPLAEYVIPIYWHDAGNDIVVLMATSNGNQTLATLNPQTAVLTPYGDQLPAECNSMAVDEDVVALYMLCNWGTSSPNIVSVAITQGELIGNYPVQLSTQGTFIPALGFVQDNS